MDVNLLRRDEDWSEPDKPKYAAFQGSGRTLAGPSTSSSAVSSAAVAASSSAAAEGEWQGVDESKPTTSLQLRMADGSRMVCFHLVPFYLFKFYANDALFHLYVCITVRLILMILGGSFQPQPQGFRHSSLHQGVQA